MQHFFYASPTLKPMRNLRKYREIHIAVHTLAQYSVTTAVPISVLEVYPTGHGFVVAQQLSSLTLTWLKRPLIRQTQGCLSKSRAKCSHITVRHSAWQKEWACKYANICYFWVYTSLFTLQYVYVSKVNGISLLNFKLDQSISPTH